MESWSCVHQTGRRVGIQEINEASVYYRISSINSPGTSRPSRSPNGFAISSALATGTGPHPTVKMKQRHLGIPARWRCC